MPDSAEKWRLLAQLLLSALLLLSVVAKVVGTPQSLQHRERLGIPPWLWRATGLAQAAGVIGLWMGLITPAVGYLTGLWLILIMVGALIAHLRVRDAARHYGTVFVLLGLSLAVLWLNWLAV
jgi:putative oxidoreductase